MQRTLSRFFGGLGLALALLSVGIAGSPAMAADYGRVLLLDRLLVCDSYGAEAKRFELELTYAVNAQDERPDTITAGLIREGHGYRQATAYDEPVIGAPVSTV